MTGHIVVYPAAEHECEGFPFPEGFPKKTLWECDECLLRWVCVKGVQYSISYSAWRILTDLNRDGSDN